MFLVCCAKGIEPPLPSTGSLPPLGPFIKHLELIRLPWQHLELIRPVALTARLPWPTPGAGHGRLRKGATTLLLGERGGAEGGGGMEEECPDLAARARPDQEEEEEEEEEEELTGVFRPYLKEEELVGVEDPVHALLGPPRLPTLSLCPSPVPPPPNHLLGTHTPVCIPSGTRGYTWRTERGCRGAGDAGLAMV